MVVRSLSKASVLSVLLAGIAGCNDAAAPALASGQAPVAQGLAATPGTRSAATPAARPPVTPAPAVATRGKQEKRTFDTSIVPKFASSVEVGGVRLGMSVEEALAALDARGGKPTASYSVQGLTPEGKITTQQRSPERSRVLPLEPQHFMTEIEHGSSSVDAESFKVIFAMPPEPNVVAGVTLTISTNRDLSKGTLESALLDAVRKKYGNDHTSAPPRRQNINFDSVAHRWLVSPGEDCYTNFAVPTMGAGGLSVWARQPSSPDYQSAPQPSACAAAVLLQAEVATSGEFKGVAAYYTLTLANEGLAYLNSVRHDALVAARQKAWVEQRQKEVAGSAAAPKL